LIAGIDKHLEKFGSLSKNWAIVQQYNTLLREQHIADEPHIAVNERLRRVVLEKLHNTKEAISIMDTVTSDDETTVHVEQMLLEHSERMWACDKRTLRLFRRTKAIGMPLELPRAVPIPTPIWVTLKAKYWIARILLEAEKTTRTNRMNAYYQASVHVREVLETLLIKSTLPGPSQPSHEALRVFPVASEGLIREEQAHGRYMDAMTTLRLLARRTQDAFQQLEEALAARHDDILEEISRLFTRTGALRALCVSEELEGKTRLQ
jgi:hypothetical protein